jgi:hypothetical protein
MFDYRFIVVRIAIKARAAESVKGEWTVTYARLALASAPTLLPDLGVSGVESEAAGEILLCVTPKAVMESCRKGDQDIR